MNDTLLKAADEIEAKGLWKSGHPETSDGTCVLLAIGEVSGTAQDEHDAYDALSEHLDIEPTKIADWSDAAPSKEFVVDALRAAAVS